MTVTLDFTNMMSEAIGPGGGLLDEELRDVSVRAKAFHEDILRRRDAGELPFFELPHDTGAVADILSLAEDLRRRFDDLVVLGIGGSALGTTAVFNALRPCHNLQNKATRGGMPRLFVLDNVDPDGLSARLALCDPGRTGFLVISKSGTTVETTSQFLYAREWVAKQVGNTYREHFILITDPEKGLLRELADREGYRSCPIPSGVGGRFTVLTSVSLLPLACVGIDIRALLAGAATFSRHVCHGDLASNPAYLNAALQYLAYGKGLRLSVFMPYSDRLRDIADWFRQLWAESLGKKFALDGSVVNVGPTPINALGVTDQHSQVQLYMEGPYDKVVTFLVVDEFEHPLELPAYHEAPEFGYLAGHNLAELIHVEQQATAAALVKNQRSNCTISIPRITPENIGALLYMLEVQTLFAGYLFAVNPLDQPGVEEGKQFTYALMGREGYREKAAEFAAITSGAPRRTLVCE